ncbi:Protein of unknown function [Robiginitalea myxolifaciens]|uniref:DUF4199 domain-containing protein n=1 Tax=Robiginitalea myxolifaciens TaxID=400055 RepID=A0A1I6G7Z3_9FLAO|nr:DUF4199 domain-containing protein [Robiginitalea myxolifaciens]SFR38231.1 Protein of unknown function [Robiginitalea myxolifaciens]
MSRFILPVRFGLATSGSLIAYFLILSLFGWHTNVFFSLFNGVITGFGIYEAIKYRKLELGNRFDYREGFTTGLTVGFTATIIFTIFFAIYSTELSPDFLAELSAAWFDDYKDFQGIVFFTVAIMGFATTLVLTLTFMQLFKPSYNLKKKP